MQRPHELEPPPVRPPSPARLHAAATSLEELERSLAYQDAELRRAFTEFRELADRGRPVPVCADAWRAVVAAVEALTDASDTIAPCRSRSAGSRASHPGTRC